MPDIGVVQPDVIPATPAGDIARFNVPAPIAIWRVFDVLDRRVAETAEVEISKPPVIAAAESKRYSFRLLAMPAS